MIRNPFVFELIKSMNMSEKRQFKIFSTRHILHSENKYLQLFDVLDEMEEYDETALKETLLAKNKLILYFKADMNFLYQQILKSLVLFHSGKTTPLILNERISVIEILYYKGNFAQCIKEITKAAAIARTTESFSSLLTVLQYEKLIYNNLDGYKRTETDILNDISRITGIIQNHIEYQQLYNKTNQIRIAVSKTRDLRGINALSELLNHPLMKHERSALSLNAKLKFYQIYAMYYYVTRAREKELLFNKKSIAVLDDHPVYKEEQLIEYVNTYSRILSITKDMNEAVFYKELNTVRSIQIPSDKLYYLKVSSQIFNFSYMIELSMYLQKKKFKDAANIINEIESGLKKYKKILTPSYKITFLYMLAYYYFSVGNYDSARRKINTLLNDYSEETRPDLYNFAKLMNLLIHFEYKNYGYIKYKRASIQYYFKKESSAFRTENTILKFFSREKNYTDDLQKSLLELKSSMEKIKQDSIEKYALNYFDFSDWVESKITRKSSIAELYN
jgi:hypothetical protein